MPEPATQADPAAISPIAKEAAGLVAQIAAHDQQIEQLEAQVRALPELLTSLIGHPVLWLLLGREGIDRPGGEWSTLVGQQVVTIYRTNWRLLIAIGLVTFLLGLAIGIAIARSA